MTPAAIFVQPALHIREHAARTALIRLAPAQMLNAFDALLSPMERRA
jgi:hypothetical protein